MASLVLLLVLGLPQAQTVRTVPAVDLDRYAGRWYEVSRLPNWFERKCIGEVTATYSRRPDGDIDVVNRCQTSGGISEAHGVARVVDTASRAKLKVRFAPAALSFLPFVWGDYWVVGLAPDYSWAVVGSPDRKYLWVLSRTPALSASAMSDAKAVARDNGFDVAALVNAGR
jgi:apolipoprotein D and lipocalin family protein